MNREGLATRVSAISLTLILTVGCGAAPTPSGAAQSATPPASQPVGPVGSFISPDAGWDDPTLLEAAFGPPVVDDGSVTYQPDVVIVGDGGAMVRGVSDDALTWIISPEAPRIDEVEEGDVMVLTGMVAGRVLARRDVPEGIALVLGPIDITDVIRDGHFEGSPVVDLDEASILVFPELPGAIVEQPLQVQGDVQLQGAAASLRGPHSLPWANRALPPLSKGSVKATVGPFAIKLKGGALEVGYNAGGLEIVISFGPIIARSPTDYALDIVEGKVTSGHVAADWLKGMVVKVQAGSESGLAGNIRYRVEIPFTYQIPIDPPLYANLKFKFLIETVFTARGSFITDEAQYDFTEAPGWTMNGGEVVLGDAPVRDTVPALDQLEAVSLGVTGLVFAFQVNDIIGMGTPLFTAGPFVEATASFGITVGSDAGIRGVKCHQATTTISLAGGVGYRWSEDADTAGALLKALTNLGVTSTAKLESLWPWKQKDLYSVATWSPDVATCQLA